MIEYLQMTIEEAMEKGYLDPADISYYEEWQEVLIAKRDDSFVILYIDGGEPEDMYLFRDLAWIRPQLQQAYKAGYQDGLDTNY
jgi:hypothetical protein